MNVHRCLAAMLLLVAWTLGHAATTQYYYDDLGRIVQAVRSDGAVFQYQYDANGNVLAINRVGASSISIAELTPRIGHAGATVTITGAGFSATPSQNEVEFNGGALGTVTSASPTTLKVTVPQAAQSGLISVTVNSDTATSAMSYTVRRPAITSFAPLAVNAGGTVTVAGVNFNLVPGGTTVNIGGVAASITAISNTQIALVAGAGSTHGVIEIVTPYGSATSATSLLMAPAGVVGANVVSTNVLQVDAAQAGTSVGQPGKSAAYSFQGTAGQYLTFQVTSLVTSPASGSLSYTLYSPTQTIVAQGGHGTISLWQTSHHWPKLTQTGTYLLVLWSSSNSFQLQSRIDEDLHLQANGASLSVATTTPGQNKRFIFTATAGDILGIAITNIVNVPASSPEQLFSMYYPNGSYWGATGCQTYTVPGCSWALRPATMSGDYQVFVYTAPGWQMTTSYNLTLSSVVTGQLALDTPQTLTLTRAGQPGRFTFTASAGQTVALYTSAISTTPASKWVTTTITGPTGSQVALYYAQQYVTTNHRNLAAGTYTVDIDIGNAATGSMQVHLVPGVTGTVAADGVPRSFSTSALAQASYFTFNATAGQNVSFALTNLSTVPANGSLGYSITAPNGSVLYYSECSWSSVHGCSVGLRNLAAGAHTVAVWPTDYRTIAFTLTLAESVTGVLTPGVPLPLNLPVSGQTAVLTFTATAGQSFTLGASSIATVPANRGVQLVILRPDGSVLDWGQGFTSASMSLPNLAAGAYTVIVHPNNAASSSLQVTLQ
jgi:trimeric autotransporter adhesin